MRQIEAFRSPGHVGLSNITGQRVTPKMNCGGQAVEAYSGERPTTDEEKDP